MVIKYTKHEIEQTFKYYLPVFGIGIVGGLLLILMVSSLHSSISSSEVPWAFTFAILGLFALSVAGTVLTIRGMLIVLYSTLYSVTGYRQFTYPITSKQRIAIKVLVSTFWNIVTTVFLGIVGLLSVAIILLIIPEGKPAFDFAIQSALEVLKSVDVLNVSLMFGNFIVSSISSILMILVVGAIANSSWIRRNRSVYAIVIYVGLSLLTSQITGWVTDGLVTTVPFVTDFAVISQSILSVEGLLISIIINIIYSILMVLATIWLWDHKLEILN